MAASWLNPGGLGARFQQPEMACVLTIGRFGEVLA